jgi:hypothetical protein
MLTATLTNVRARASSVALEVAELRVAALVLCAVGALLPVVPFYPGITCPLRAATGIPCPLCGLTGSIRAGLRLDVAEAWSLNPGGLAAIGAALALLLTRRPLITLPAAVVPLGLGGLWIFELFRFDRL